MGEGALASDSTGSLNVSIGAGSMENHLRGNDNVAMGFWAGRSDSAATGAVYIGRDAGYSNQRDYTVAIGYQALYNNGVGAAVASDGNANTAVGKQAMFGNTLGQLNTALGFESMHNNTTGNYNTAIGYRALYSSNASFNTAIGTNNLVSATGGSNTAIGSAVMQSALTGSSNVGIGTNALNNATSADNNIAIGPLALITNTTGDNNIGIGVSSLDLNSSGSNNVALGSQALFNTTTGNNTALGHLAGITNVSGTNNTLLGYSANVSVNSLTNATAIGANASVATSNSLVLGSGANVGIGTSSPGKLLHVFGGASGATFNANTNILLENNINSYMEMSTPAANENGIISSIPVSGIRSAVIFRADSSIRLRSGGNIERLIIDKLGYAAFNRTPTTGVSAGTLQVQNVGSSDDIFGLYNSSTGNRWTYWITTSASGGPPAYSTNDLTMWYNGAIRGAYNNATGAYTIASDKRLKKDITTYEYGLSTILQLQPYKYRYLDNNSSVPLTVGFMAQDVEKIYPEAIHKITDKEGKEIYTLDYQTFGVLAIKGIQEQQQIIEALKKKNEQLEKDMQLIKTKLGINN